MWSKQLPKQEQEQVKQVKCEECKHYIDLADAQEVEDGWGLVYYCPIHKKPYDRVLNEERWCTNKKGREYWDSEPTYYKFVPEHYVKVDEAGKEIKTKK